ncbi:MAG TPA: hypothetical protein VHV82_08275 [Sporichthyaceae bacterium]|jgi:hypothetical protein|nr:hypothetical protein [Sporichthyaceae bacterium]
MTPEFTFSSPTPQITTARLALARLERHLHTAVDPCDAGADCTDLMFAIMGLEDVHPPYPPLSDEPGAGPDPRADLELALTALRAAIEKSDTAGEILRLALVVRDLLPLSDSPHLGTAGADQHGPGR